MAKLQMQCEICQGYFAIWPSQRRKGGGRFCSMGCRNKWQSWRMTGQRNHMYIDGRTPLKRKWHSSRENAQWRSEVFERDQFTCQSCGQAGAELNAHHIAPISKHPELRLDLDNGVTLCKACHDFIPKRYTPDVVFIPTKTLNAMIGELSA